MSVPINTITRGEEMGEEGESSRGEGEGRRDNGSSMPFLPAFFSPPSNLLSPPPPPPLPPSNLHYTKSRGPAHKTCMLPRPASHTLIL